MREFGTAQYLGVIPGDARNDGDGNSGPPAGIQRGDGNGADVEKGKREFVSTEVIEARDNRDAANCQGDATGLRDPAETPLEIVQSPDQCRTTR